MNKKNILVLLSLLCVSSSTLANSVYVGFQGGADFFSVKKSVTTDLIDPTLILPVPPIFSQNRNTGTGGIGGIFIGYSWRFPVTDLGLEVFAAGDSSQSKQTIANSEHNTDLQLSTSEKLKGYYGFAVKPGYFINDKAKIYGKIGWLRGRFSIEGSQAGFLGTTSTSPLSNWLGGFQLGAGAEIFLNPNLALNLEYNHVQYQKRRYVSTFIPPTTIGDFTPSPEVVTASYRPQSNNVLVGLTYYFHGLTPSPKDDGDYSL